jgi:putative hydrolase of the HAD superfamily
MTPPRIAAVLFDVAGTLLRPRRAIGATYAELAREHGVEVSPAVLEPAFRRVLAQAPPMVFANLPAAEVERCERGWWRQRVWEVFESAGAAVRFADFDAFFDQLFRHFARAEAWQVMPGARELLGGLRRRGLRTGVVSNFDHRLEGILTGLDLRPLFDVVVRPADAAAAKPDPRIFTCALQRLGVSAAVTLYVGDDAVQDIEGARAAGLQAVDVAALDRLDALLERL